jgi:hypothetical protein
MPLQLRSLHRRGFPARDQCYQGLNHPRRERMAEIVEREVLDLCSVKRGDQEFA